MAAQIGNVGGADEGFQGQIAEAFAVRYLVERGVYVAAGVSRHREGFQTPSIRWVVGGDADASGRVTWTVRAVVGDRLGKVNNFALLKVRPGDFQNVGVFADGLGRQRDCQGVVGAREGERGVVA